MIKVVVPSVSARSARAVENELPDQSGCVDQLTTLSALCPVVWAGFPVKFALCLVHSSIQAELPSRGFQTHCAPASPAERRVLITFSSFSACVISVNETVPLVVLTVPATEAFHKLRRMLPPSTLPLTLSWKYPMGRRGLRMGNWRGVTEIDCAEPGVWRRVY